MNDLFGQSKLVCPIVTCRNLNEAANNPSNGVDFDAGIIWIRDQNSSIDSLFSRTEFASSASTELEYMVHDLPLILVTDHDITLPSLGSLRKRVVEHLLSHQLTPQLMAFAVGYITNNRQLQYALDESNIRYTAVLDAIAEGVVICDNHGLIESMNPVAERIFATSQDVGVESRLTDFVDRNSRGDVNEYFQQTGVPDMEEAPAFVREVRGVRSNGQVFPMELLISSTQLSKRDMFTCIVRDITLNKQKEEELQLTATAFETHTAILITDVNGSILRVNPAFTHITGYSVEEAVGNNPKMLQSGYHGKEFYDDLWGTIKRTGRWEGEIWNKRKSGEIYPEYQTITAVKNKQGHITHYVATFQDITERKQAQALIEHQAFYDALTNLPNRRMVLDRLNQELSSARRHGYFGALLFLDIDHFKTLNDSMGHAVGDSLLQQMAKRLTRQIRKEDTVARLGGDEFVVLLANLSDNEKSATSMASSIASKIRAVISESYDLEGHSFNFSPSIGVTLYPFADDTADDVLKHADTAMYRAKSKGRNTICFYKTSMQAEADRRLQLEKDLRIAIEAIDREQLVLYYQPQFNNKDQLVGAEALIRWNHPARGVVEPKDFIALSEEANLIQAIGIWVLDTAFKQLCDWRKSGLFANNEYIAVNVSPKQIQQDNFVSEVARLMGKHNVPRGCVKLELTETVLLHDLHDVIGKMNQLKALGVTFSMDDFGTGFSSLSYLKRLPFDQIKIDKTFIKDVSRNVNDAIIVEAIIAMAEHLKLDVIAEGVETREEFEFLQDKGCNSYQGFYFSTPLKASSFAQALRQILKSNKASGACGG